MTDRQRIAFEFERAHASARRALVLAVSLLAGALVGYHPAPGPDAPIIISATTSAP